MLNLSGGITVDSGASLEARRGLAPPSLIEPLTNHQPARRGPWCLSPRVQARVVIFMLAGVASGDMAQNCPRHLTPDTWNLGLHSQQAAVRLYHLAHQPLKTRARGPAEFLPRVTGIAQ